MATFNIDFYVKSLGRKTRLDLVIPSLNLQGCLKNNDENYYQNLNEKYPLMICLHGFGDNEKGWQNNSSIIKMCEENKIAACFINGENKWYLNMGPIDDFYSLIERDVIDFLYGNFNCLSKKMPLAIAGVSMGGYGALYHYLKNTDKYNACIALSPATKPDYIDESKYGTLKELFIANKDKKLNVYLSIGMNDFIYQASKEFDNYLEENNIGVRYKFIEGCDHSWTTWAKEMPKVFTYLKEVKFYK